MIITQTPFRVSFAGGGTDLEAFYGLEDGAVLSTAIRRHMYVTVHDRFADDLRVSYSKTEIVDNVESLGHDLVREAMFATGTREPLEVTTIADVPAGTGLGSSSTLTVGLLNAFHARKGRVVSRDKLAATACEIEIERLGNPIGKQDQYAAAFGGINYIQFRRDGTVDVQPVPCRTEIRADLERHSLCVYTAQRRSANDVLARQKEGTADKLSVLRGMRDLAAAMRDDLVSGAGMESFGSLLHDGWELKRSLGFGISNARIDEWYSTAQAHGAFGGKLLGAGGGGFLYLIAPPERHADILDALGNPKTLPFELDPLGSRIAFISE